MYRPVLVTPPTIKPVTLTEAKAALDIGYSEKDLLIGGLIAAATSYLDGWTGILGRALCEQTWRQDFDRFQCWSNGRDYRYPNTANRLRLPLSPVISITSVKYTDVSGVEQTVDPASYSLKCDDIGCYVEFVSTYVYPIMNIGSASARVSYLAGYADVAGTPKTSGVPDSIKQAMLLLIRQWFDNPTAVNVGTIVTPMPFAVNALLMPFRRVKF